MSQFQEDRQAVVQALLNRPFLHRQQDTELYLVARENYKALRDWFYERTGWALILTREFVRLEKIPGKWQRWMAITGFRDGRDYGYFTFGLWYLEGLGDGHQFLLSEMVEAIQQHLVAAGIFVDWTVYEHRLAMARALKKLRDLDALQAVDGDESEWARSGNEADVLYQSSHMARYLLQRLPEDIMSYHGVSDLDRRKVGEMDDMVNDSALNPSQPTAQSDVADAGSGYQPEALDSQSAAALQRRHTVMRRLLEEPVVYDWQWTEDERRYVQTQRSFLISRVNEFTGLEGRRFREGLVFTWPELSAEMDLFPTQGVLSDIIILLSGEVRRRLEDAESFHHDENGCYLLTRSELETLLLGLRGRYGEWWSKEYREKSTAGLAQDVISHLEEWNLGERLENGGVRLLPAFMRWFGDYVWEGGDET